ncbi:MAG: hypothetical protein EB127_18810 [Alphaproteobacteria bacterium]|nr:hypothetical protein [Alphaproteobacteria bacterium]
MPSNVLVSGAGLAEVNGIYTYRGVYSGKPYYNLVGYEDSINAFSIFWFTPSWILIGTEEVMYEAFDQSIDYPWLGTWSNSNGIEPPPIVTEIPSQPTFGLPADVVALITSRFGTVANFLRLRNQGQV